MSEYEDTLKSIATILKHGDCESALCYSGCPLPCHYFDPKNNRILIDNNSDRIVERALNWMNENNITKADLLPYLF